MESKYTLGVKQQRKDNMEKYYLGLGGQLADEELKRIGHQSLFLLNLVNVIPETMDEIQNLYLSFEQICGSFGKKPNSLLDFSAFDEVTTMDLFKKEIKTWAKDWYINEEWVIEYLFQTFMVWFENEQTKYNLFLFNPVIGKVQNLIDEVNQNGQLVLPIYNPATESEQLYRKRVEKIVNSYIGKTNKVFWENRFSNADEKRTTNHYMWFIHYHVLGETFEDIAHEFFKDGSVDKVRKEIKKIYDSIGLNEKIEIRIITKNKSNKKGVRENL